MKVEDRLNSLMGVLDVQVEGFFTERFINLCKIKKIKIWNIRNIRVGVVVFSIAKKDYNRLDEVCEKTKCEAKIINRKGIYFKAFKYRKRSAAIFLISSFVILSVYFTNIIWNIEVIGNEKVSTDSILNTLKQNGLTIGKNKLNLNKKKIMNNLRIEIKDIAWVGIEFDGSKAIIKVVEKTRLDSNNVEDGVVGDILSSKDGIIYKMTVENGTAISKVGDYVEKDRILIEGKLYSKFIDAKDVAAQGEIILNTKYYFKKYYSYVVLDKMYLDKKRYSIGFTLNDRENYINYLDKSLNYDIIKSGKSINIFGNSFGINIFSFNIYDLKERTVTKEEIQTQAIDEANSYMQESVLPNIINGSIINSVYSIVAEDENGIEIQVEFDVLENVGYFRERN